MSTAQQLRETGEAMGLKGSELVIFVREQQTLENERKAKEDERLEKARFFELERARLESKEKEEARQERERRKDS